MSHTQENKELCNLININKDAAEFYNDAREKVEDPRFVTTFTNLELIHTNVANNIESQVRLNGGEPDADGTMLGKAAQFFGEIMAKVSNDVDETLVAHLEEAEDRCLHSMQDAMKDDDITLSTRSVLSSELTALRKTHDYMKELKECMKAA